MTAGEDLLVDCKGENLSLPLNFVTGKSMGTDTINYFRLYITTEKYFIWLLDANSFNMFGVLYI